MKLLKKAFAAGKKTIDQPALKAALEAHDEQAALTALSPGIDAIEVKLTAPLEAMLLEIIGASGRSAAKALNQKFRPETLRSALLAWKFDETNPKATDWAREHAAELVKGLSDTSRDEIREAVEAAFEEQIDVDELASELTDLLGDAERAELIARTETMRASNEGQQAAWDQALDTGLLTGREKQEWITTPDDRLCPICEPLDGQVTDLDGKFDVDGEQVDSPPAHPNCRCTVALSF